MKSSAISAWAPVLRAAKAWPSSWMSVNTARKTANGMPNVGPWTNTTSTMNIKKPARTWTGKPEEAEHARRRRHASEPTGAKALQNTGAAP